MRTYTSNPKPKYASFGAIMQGLQIGQSVGNMMPDNGVGNFIQGSLDPINNFSNAMSYMGEGKIGKGLLAMIPGFGNAMTGLDRRKEEAALAAKAKQLSNDQYFASKKRNDTSELIAMNNTHAMPYGGKITRKPISFPKGGNTSSGIIPQSNNGLLDNSQTLTNAAGTTTGSHETGQNIPITDGQGNTQVIAEPGEVKVTNPDGSIDILSKRLGFAQRYENLDFKVKRLQQALAKETDVAQRNAMERELKGFEKEKELVVQQQRMVAEQMGNEVTPDGTPMAPSGFNLKPNQVGYINPNEGWSPNQYKFNPTNDVSLKSTLPEFTGIPNLNVPNFDYGSGEKGGFLDKFKDPNTLNHLQTGLNLIAPAVANAKNRRDMRKVAKEINDFTIRPNEIQRYMPTMNIDADVSAINSNYADTMKLGKEVSNPMTANFLANVAGSNRLQSLNPVHQQKINFDTTAKAGVMNYNNQVTNQNINSQNELDKMKLDSRTGLTLSNIDLRQANVNSLAKFVAESNMKQQDKTRLELLIQQLDRGDGVLNANVMKQIQDMFRSM